MPNILCANTFDGIQVVDDVVSARRRPHKNPDPEPAPGDERRHRAQRSRTRSARGDPRTRRRPRPPAIQNLGWRRTASTQRCRQPRTAPPLCHRRPRLVVPHRLFQLSRRNPAPSARPAIAAATRRTPPDPFRPAAPPTPWVPTAVTTQISRRPQRSQSGPPKRTV